VIPVDVGEVEGLLDWATRSIEREHFDRMEDGGIYVGARNDITLGEFISTVVSSPLAVVPRMRKRCSRRGDISQGHLILNVLRRLMTASEHCWRPLFTRCSGKSACAGNVSTTKLRHREAASMAAKIAW
jgi:hypothetical protein